MVSKSPAGSSQQLNDKLALLISIRRSIIPDFTVHCFVFFGNIISAFLLVCLFVCLWLFRCCFSESGRKQMYEIH